MYILWIATTFYTWAGYNEHFILEWSFFFLSKQIEISDDICEKMKYL